MQKKIPYAISSQVRESLLNTTFNTSLFLTAILIYWLEPLFGKIILPFLGGGTNIWLDCLLFFQGSLFIGCLYAFVSSRLLSLTKQIILHMALLATSLFFLPISFNHFDIINYQQPNISIIFYLFMNIGLPVCVLSGTSPLLQRWFGYTLHPAAKDPYYLYTTWNIGSLFALLLFLLVFEPIFSISTQNIYWFILSTIMFAALVACTVLVINSQMTIKSNYKQFARSKKNLHPKTKVSWLQRAYWILLAFASTSLLFGVTNYITAELGNLPLFWFLPLGLFLLSYIIAFSKWKIIPQRYALIIQLCLLLPFTILYAFSSNIHHTWFVLSIHLLTFFFTALICINELFSRRPQLNKLTEFYFWISLGGFLGALFNSLIAPLIFQHILEYPIALAIACMMRPTGSSNRLSNSVPQDFLWPIGIFIIIFLIGTYTEPLKNGTLTFSTITLVVLLITIIFAFPERTIRFALGIGAILIASTLYLNPLSKNTIFIDRNFFGTVKIINDPKINAHLMIQGNTIQGVQYFDEESAFSPLKHISLCSTNPREKLAGLATFSKLYNSVAVTYFAPLQQIINALHQTKVSLHIGIAGLGTGTAACLANESDHLIFYEINPEIIKIAKNKKYFSYISDCPPDEIIQGDARSSIEKSNNYYFDLLVLDAFNSDTIPTHLITLNAVELYLNKLSDHGIIAFNISNHSLNLIPVLSAITNNLHLYGLLNIEKFQISKQFQYASIWYVIARHENDLDEIAKNGNWLLPPPSYQSTLWTDDFSNVTQLIG